MTEERLREIDPQSSIVDFDPLAGQYDQWYETAEGRQFDRLEKKAFRRLIGKAEKGESMLEVGTGTGWWSQFFGELGYQVTGVDVAPKMVEIARSKNIPNARFEKADGHKLPFSDHSFSASAAVTTLEFTREPETVVREMVRCTKTGGKLFLGVLNRDAPLNKERKEKGEGVFAPARFFTVHEIQALLAPYGKPVIKQCAFSLSLRMPNSIAGIADDLQALLKMSSGAFIAARVDL
ncbi:MAG: class I SAM-dependent methyltransferase [Deltaproteobacteria bacterium]|nr:class I SAM-dependent methyltransferase [Deltaproteobacteria bacterium]